MIKKEKKISVNLQSDDTDSLLPRAWKSGSLKYDELKPLSEGGTAKLFTTLDLNLRRDVAYKTLHSDLRDSEIETKRFLREARVTANIQHPGTVPLYELGRDREGQLFFTMKKVEGRDLREILFDPTRSARTLNGPPGWWTVVFCKEVMEFFKVTPSKQNRCLKAMIVTCSINKCAKEGRSISILNDAWRYLK